MPVTMIVFDSSIPISSRTIASSIMIVPIPQPGHQIVGKRSTFRRRLKSSSANAASGMSADPQRRAFDVIARLRRDGRIPRAAGEYPLQPVTHRLQADASTQQRDALHLAVDGQLD